MATTSGFVLREAAHDWSLAAHHYEGTTTRPTPNGKQVAVYMKPVLPEGKGIENA